MQLSYEGDVFMKKAGNRIIALSVMAACAFWVIDSLIDYFVFYEESFLEVFILDHRELSFRILSSIFVIGFGVLISRTFVVQKRVEEKLRGNEFKLEKLLREKEVLLSEVHHRVKNNMAIISAFLSLQSNYIDDKQLIAMFSESQNRIHSMAMVHERLYKHNNFSTIDFKEYAEALSKDLIRSHGFGMEQVGVVTNIDDTALCLNTLIPCGLIMNELITNSLKYAFKDATEPEIRIALESEDDTITMSVTDNGIGLPDEIELNQSRTLGLKIVYQLILQLGGNVEIDRSNGTEFRISFKPSEKKHYRSN